MHFSPKEWLNRYQVKPDKQLGQNFLINPFTCYQIADLAQIEASDIVVEIGSGIGNLTIPLAAKAEKVIAIEYDERLIKVMNEVLKTYQADNVEIWHQNAMNLDFSKIYETYQKRIKVVGNLPYQLSSPLLFLFWQNKGVIKDLTLMLQKEVAERLRAKPGSKKYGLLSVIFGLQAEIHSLLNLSPQSFYPAPKVSSEVIRISWKGTTAHLPKAFVRFLKQIFAKRRKTILNALKGQYAKEIIMDALAYFNINPSLRPEQVTPEELWLLFKYLQPKCH